MKTTLTILFIAAALVPAYAEIPFFQTELPGTQQERSIPPDKFINKYRPEPVPSIPSISDQLSLQELSFLIHRYRGRIRSMVLNHRGSVSAIHHWEHGARIDRFWDGRFDWVSLGSSKGNGNRTSLRISNCTRVCLHLHPEDSVPWPSHNDRIAARNVMSSLRSRCMSGQLSLPAYVWMVTVHTSGQVWAWREGLRKPVLVVEQILPVKDMAGEVKLAGRAER